MSKKEKVLVIGASPNPRRYSYLATQMLSEYDHAVYPLGIRNGVIGSYNIELIWPENQSFDTITLYVGPTLQEQYFEAVVKLKPKRVIFNPGTENEQFYALLTENGIAYEQACTLVLLRTNQF